MCWTKNARLRSKAVPLRGFAPSSHRMPVPTAHQPPTSSCATPTNQPRSRNYNSLMAPTSVYPLACFYPSPRATTPIWYASGEDPLWSAAAPWAPVSGVSPLLAPRTQRSPVTARSTHPHPTSDTRQHVCSTCMCLALPSVHAGVDNTANADLARATPPELGSLVLGAQRGAATACCLARLRST
jgi:hypothetical protein